jgi:radical SAM superfamily enzyme YgiQ (UPF0313 family)
MRILFLNLPYRYPVSRSSRWPEKTKSGTLYYPYWLAYACGWARKASHEVNLIDAIAAGLTGEETISRVLAWAPDLLVTEMCTPTSSADGAFLAALKEKGFRGITAVAGTHATVLFKEVLERFPGVDFCLIGEYDRTVTDLAADPASPERVAGLAWRQGSDVRSTEQGPPIRDLDDFPFVTSIYREFLDLDDYCYSLAQKPMVQVLSARGCPFRCNFCQYPQTMCGRTYRKRSVDNFIEELRYIRTSLPRVREIFIEDDTFTVDKARVEEICDRMIAEKIGIAWSCNARADLPLKTIKKMKEAGCRLLVVGYESGDQGVLDRIRKGITLEQSREFALNTKKAGLKVFGCFMIGLSGETRETIRRTFRFARETSADMVFFQQAVPFPGTAFYQECVEKNMLTTRDFDRWLKPDGTLDCIVDYPEMTASEICATRDRLMSRYYFSLPFLLRTLASNLSFSELRRIVKAGVAYVVFRLFKRNNG